MSLTAAFIRTAYQARFSTQPDIVVRAPGRINLIGEHTDYNGGFVLPAAIDKAIWIAASRRDDGRFAFFAQDLGAFFTSESEHPVFQEQQLWVNYLLGVVSEARKDGLVFGGLNLAFGGDVPLGAGLSSSAALESGVMFVLNELYHLGLSRMDIVRLAQRGENNFVGMKCGIMDMFASVMSRENQVVRLDCRSLEYDYFPFHAPDHSLVLLDSGVKHSLVDSAYNTRRSECETGVSILNAFAPPIDTLRDVSLALLQAHESDMTPIVFKRCRFIVEEIDRVQRACTALQMNDFTTLGQLMFECHDGLNEQYEVCVPETNFLVEMGRVPVLLNQTQTAASARPFLRVSGQKTPSMQALSGQCRPLRCRREQSRCEAQPHRRHPELTMQEARKVFDRSLATSRNRQTDLNNLRTQGLALDNDVLKAELAIAQLESAQAETDNAIRAAQFSIAVLCDLSEGADIQIDSTSIFASQESLPTSTNTLPERPIRPTGRAHRSVARPLPSRFP